MTKNLLVELGLEELPAYVVTPSEKQLGEKMAAFLKENRLSFEAIQTFSTPRRLAVRVTGLADKQADLTEDFKGPAKKIALDSDGNFTLSLWKNWELILWNTIFASLRITGKIHRLDQLVLVGK